MHAKFNIPYERSAPSPLLAGEESAVHKAFESIVYEIGALGQQQLGDTLNAPCSWGVKVHGLGLALTWWTQSGNGRSSISGLELYRFLDFDPHRGDESDDYDAEGSSYLLTLLQGQGIILLEDERLSDDRCSEIQAVRNDIALSCVARASEQYGLAVIPHSLQAQTVIAGSEISPFEVEYLWPNMRDTEPVPVSR